MSTREIIYAAAGASGPATYIEDVFSTYLYTGNGGTQTITNGIDLAGEGGMVWTKSRSQGTANTISDTVRGREFILNTNATTAETSSPAGRDLVSFNSNGFTVGPVTNYFMNANGQTYVGWTFREQAKFFDVVTYTGNGAADRNIAHNLGSVPGMIVIKKTSGTGNWATAASLSSTVYGIGGGGAGSGYEFSLNLTDVYYDNPLKSTIATDTTVNVPRVYFNDATVCNASGATYVMYLFASNAGGFGLTGTDNVISCGSFVHNSSTEQEINLGYEAQFVLLKGATSATGWQIVDNMRGMPFGGNARILQPDTSGVEFSGQTVYPTAKGFAVRTGAYLNGATITYMAIRRGPMRTPTSGTSVFAPYVTNTVAASASGSTSTQSLYRSDFVTDFVIQTRKAFTDSKYAVSRLTGNQFLTTNTTDAESTSTVPWDSNIAALNFSSNYGQWMFRRAPGFLDVVCWTGNASTNQTVNHNLGAIPELIITKSRGNVTAWLTYAATEGVNRYALLNTSGAFATITNVWPAAPTSTTFSIDMTNYGAAQSSTMIAYLFATVAGVSKVGSYTGTGSTQTINAGLPTGARFVMIKRTDSTSDWRVWDSARGMVSGTSNGIPYNTTAAETNSNDIYTTTNGFQLANGDGSINGSGGSYIYLAIA